MNRRQWMIISGGAGTARHGVALAQRSSNPEELPDRIPLKDYRPKSIFKIPRTEIKKAKFPSIDVHSHVNFPTPIRSAEDVDEVVKIMDAAGVERSVFFAGATGSMFDEVARLYSHHPGRFEIWCSLDLTDYDKPDFGPRALRGLERCHRMGARGSLGA